MIRPPHPPRAPSTPADRPTPPLPFVDQRGAAGGLQGSTGDRRGPAGDGRGEGSRGWQGLAGDGWGFRGNTQGPLSLFLRSSPTAPSWPLHSPQHPTRHTAPRQAPHVLRGGSRGRHSPVGTPFCFGTTYPTYTAYPTPAPRVAVGDEVVLFLFTTLLAGGRLEFFWASKGPPGPRDEKQRKNG